MALTIQVTKISVTQPQEGLFVVTMNLTCLDESVEALNRNFSENKRPAVPWTTVGGRMKKAVQAAINEYKESATIFDSAEMDDAATLIQNALTG